MPPLLYPAVKRQNSNITVNIPFFRMYFPTCVYTCVYMLINRFQFVLMEF